MLSKANELHRDITNRLRGWLQRAEHYARRNLLWGSAYRAASYTKSALWVVPFIAILLVLFIAPTLRVIDGWLGWRIAGLDIAGAEALYQTVITLTLSFLVFTFGSLLVAIQVAGGQLTPRIIATTLLRDNVVRYAVGLFVFSMMFAISALNRLETHVHQLVLLLAGALAVMSMASFLYLIDYAARLLRPISILSRVAERGFAVVEHLYPRPTQPSEADKTQELLGPSGRIVTHTGASQVLLTVDLPSIVAAARTTDGFVELIPSVGDFVGRDEPLFALHGGAVSIKDDRLRDAVLFGAERTMEQDPTFSFRIVIDIALKALSPAIN